jgi:hypothetical protein
MDSSAAGLWLLPSYDRPTTNLARFFRVAKATGMTTPGAVLVDESDYAAQPDLYDAVEMPENWTIHLVKGGDCANSTRQGLAELFTDDMQWIGWLADDLVPETEGWDTKCIAALTGWNCVSTDDGRFAPQKMNGATVWSGDLVRAVGYLYPPDMKHYYIDDCWEELGRMMNCWVCLMDVLVRHAHADWSPDGKDQTATRSKKFWANDEPAFTHWKNTERLPAANRIGQLLIDYKVSEALPDLSHVRVLIATPSGSGKYERLFVSALFGTIETLRQCKATVNFVEIPYCSDIALARNKIFGMFMRSDATHLMSIDDDMGWQPQDVVRLFSHKRDYVSVAGPRKVFPQTFAVQNADAQGRAMPLRQESTGLFEVSHVGMAFTLVTKNWAERMAAAHPELEFSGDDGRVEYGIFNPMIANRRYMSEDYAACERWRALGGKLYVDPSISLKHVGAFVWEGDWLSHLVSMMNEQKRAA